MGIKFVAAAEPDLVLALAFKTRVNAARVLAGWWHPRRDAVTAIEDVGERRTALENLYEERNTLRRAGVLLDTADAIITCHLHLEMIERGWDHDDWPPAPSVPGRPLGSRNNPGRDWTGRLQVRLDDSLAIRLQRATYHASAPATRALQQLTNYPGGDDHPDREELAAQIVTPADLLRAALGRATADMFPATHPTPTQPPHP